MSNVKDGGAAFPRQDTDWSEGCYGMSLRDWFAGQALNQRKMLATGAYYAADAAREAYEIADAMLAERDKALAELDGARVAAEALRDIPFPDCASRCLAIERLGATECPAVCPHKFHDPTTQGSRL